MTTQEAAVELHISVRRVRVLIDEGRLKASKRGRDWWIEPKDLETVRNRKNGRPRKEQADV